MQSVACAVLRRPLHTAAIAAAQARTLEAIRQTARGAFIQPVRTGDKVAVVLLKQLDNLGHRGAECMVAPGYARNFLVPQGLAVYATQDNKAKHKVVLSEEDARKNALERETNMLRAHVSEVRLRFVQATSDGETLLSSLTSADIVEALQTSVLRKYQVRDKNIRLPSSAATVSAASAAAAPAATSTVAFNKVGEHTIEIEVKPGLWCPMKIDIEGS